MLAFIERYQQYQAENKNLPRKIEQINELLKSDYWGETYTISHGIKKGQFLVIHHGSLDEFGNPELTICSSLSSACSAIYRCICKNILFKHLAKINFEAKNKIVKKFPKKYHKLIDKLLNELFIYDEHFEVNCKLLLPKETRDGLFYDNYKGGKDSETFAYLIYDNLTFAEKINHETDSLSIFVNSLFDTDKMCPWATQLRLKEPILSPQQKWNQENPETIRESDRAYKEKNPNYQFYPSLELIERMESARKNGESTSNLVNRLLDKALPKIKT